jgi:hypothetical protein
LSLDAKRQSERRGRNGENKRKEVGIDRRGNGYPVIRFKAQFADLEEGKKVSCFASR